MRGRLFLGLLLVGGAVALALLAPLLFPEDPMDMVGRPNLWPGTDGALPLGTDMMGRDLAAGIAHGARASLLVGVLAAAGALLLGSAVGAVAGYAGGVADAVLMRVTELFQTMPPFLFAIAVVAVLGPSLPHVVLAIAVTSWPAIAHLMRAEVLAVKGRDFVAAAVTSGARPTRVLLRHILPNCLSPVLVTASVLVATAILTEAGLAFLNMSDPNLVTWGGMIGNGRETLRTHWYMSVLPGVVLAMTVLGFNLLGDALDDILDPLRRG